ncbi:MAG: M67 family metallopeptidase [Candidatus Symbiothrix sp.]|jgi:proteasome lid subunit RPN8/RPN11|nr:M67 family metallopeptidase [Candidatus Symbiothrix sp.]
MICIPQKIIDGIIEQARNELPNEACGLLAGEIIGNASNTLQTVSIKKQYPMENIDRSPEHFSFDPKEQFSVLREARVHGLRIVANYHSHPASPARPSQEDIRLAFDPNIFYLILSLQEEDNPVLKAFSIRAGEVVEVEIQSDKS